MAGILGITTTDYNVVAIGAGNTNEYLKLTVASGQNVLTKGTVLGKVTASNKFIEWLPGAVDGSEVACAILNEDIDATSADVKTVAIIGKVKASLLVFGTSTNAQKAVALTQLQNNGVFIDVDILDFLI